MLLNMDRVLGLLAEGKDIEKIAVLASCPREDVVALIEEARTLLARHEGPRFRKKVVLKKKIQRIGDDERYEEEERELFQGAELSKIPLNGTLTFYIGVLMQDKAAKAAILIEDQNAVQLGSLRFGLSVFDADIALCRSIGKALRVARYFQCEKAKIRIGKQVLVKLLQKKITTGNTDLAAEIEVLQALAAELPESSFEMMKPGQIEKVAFLAENDFNESTHTNTPRP